MKKLITALVAITLITISLPAQANLKNRTSVPTLAIVDTALDTSIPQIKSRLVGEVCILDWASCPNGKTFMEGEGASTLPSNIISNSNFNHGTQMASIALQNNPNMNILFVRIIGHTSRGMRQTTSVSTLPNALSWINNNISKYNISAVAISQGNHSVIKKTNVGYCPITATDIAIDRLYSVGVPVFFPAGNDRDRSRIDWPACIPNAVAVGGAESYGDVSIFSNYDKALIDIWDLSTSSSIYPGNKNGNSFGTSVANQVAAAKFVALKSSKPTMSLTDLINLIKSKANPITNSLKQEGLLFNLEAALNG